MGIPYVHFSPGGGNGNPLQYSYLENSRDRGAWRAAVHELQRVRHGGVTEHTTQVGGEEEFSLPPLISLCSKQASYLKEG